MGSEGKCVQPPCFSQLVQDVQVGIDVETVVVVGRVVLEFPGTRVLHVLLRPPLRLALIVYHVEAYHLQMSQVSHPPPELQSDLSCMIELIIWQRSATNIPTAV